MKTDAEVHLMLRERRKGKTPRTSCRTRWHAPLPHASISVRAHYRANSSSHAHTAHAPTRSPTIWPWVQAHLERDSAVQAHTLFALLCDQHPGRYQSGQLRTLQRRIALWRAQHGPDREVMFAQIHHPGQRAQSDFTHMTDLNITLAGHPFPHLLYHLVLTYSNVEAVQICFSESFESLADGIVRN